MIKVQKATLWQIFATRKRKVQLDGEEGCALILIRSVPRGLRALTRSGESLV